MNSSLQHLVYQGTHLFGDLIYFKQNCKLSINNNNNKNQRCCEQLKSIHQIQPSRHRYSVLGWGTAGPHVYCIYCHCTCVRVVTGSHNVTTHINGGQIPGNSDLQSSTYIFKEGNEYTGKDGKRLKGKKKPNLTFYHFINL